MLTACGSSNGLSDILVGVVSQTQPIVVNAYSEEACISVEVYVDGENKISSVKGQTIGSREFAENVGLEGMDFYEGLTKHFHALYENGYFGENWTLRVETNVGIENSSIYQFIAQYELENDIDINLSGVYYGYISEVIDGDKITASKEDGNRRYQEEHYDANGVITSAIVEMADGTHHEQLYDVNGNRIESVEEYSDGE